MTASSDNPAEGSDRQLPAWYAQADPAHSVWAINEYVVQQGFPTVEQFRRGILLGCIAHSLWLAANQGLFAHNQYWYDDTYVDNNDQGEWWAVSFTPEGSVAVFYSTESERNPFPNDSPPYDQARYFQGMPTKLQTAKEQALAYMESLDGGLGGPNAAITAAMWADGERFTSNEPWEVVFNNTGWGCSTQLLPLDVALVEWKNQFSLNDDGVAVVRSLYLRRLASTEPMIPIEAREREIILQACGVSITTKHGENPEFIRLFREGVHAMAATAGYSDDAGLRTARDALASVGIDLGVDNTLQPDGP